MEISKLAEAGVIILLGLGASVITYRIAARSKLRLPVALPPRVNMGIDWLAGGMVIGFGLIFCAITMRRYATQSFFGDDYTFFYQSIWNSQHGRLLENTAYLDSLTLLGHHFSPILLMFVPLFVFENSPRIFSMIPAYAMTLAALPLYWFARQQLNRILAVVVLLLFFFSPLTQHMGTYQFYDSILAVPLLMFTMFFVMRQQYGPFLACIILATMVKEDIAIIVVGLGIFIAFIQRKRILGLSLAIAGVVTLLALIQWIIPYFHGGTNYYFFGGTLERPGFNLYAYLGNSLAQVVLTALTRPDLVLQHVLIEPKIEALIYLFVPLGLLPFVGIEVAALTLPLLMYILLADLPHVYSPNNYHYAPIIPFLFFSLVIGIRRIIFDKNKSLARTTATCVFALVSCLGSALIFNQGQPFAVIDLNRFPLTSHTARAEPISEMIPKGTSVLAVTELMPLISDRQHAYVMPAIPCLGTADYIFTDTQRPWYSYRKTLWEELLALPLFETVLDEDGYILKKRILPANHVDIKLDDQFSLLGVTTNLTGTVAGGSLWQPVLTWRLDRPTQEQYMRIARVTDERNHVWILDEAPLGGTFCALDRSVSGTTIGDPLQFELPPTMPGGTYRLSVSVHQEKKRNHESVNLAEEIPLGTFAVEKNTASFTASQLKIEFPLFVDMGEMRFLGSTVIPTEIAGGEEIPIGLYWRARTQPTGDYFVSLQLRDSANRILVEEKNRPALGRYPTTQWSAGEVLLDWHDVIVPPSILPGEYNMIVQLGDVTNGSVIGETALRKILIKGQ